MNTQPIIMLDSPVLPVEEYARRTGQALSAVKRQANEGKIPTLQEGKGAKLYVNMVAMYKTASDAAEWNMQAPNAAYSI